MNMRTLRGEEMTGTDAEACAYLFTVALTRPMDHDWGQIYLYIATKTYQRWGKNEMPTDIAVESISDYQMAELKPAHFLFLIAHSKLSCALDSPSLYLTTEARFRGHLSRLA